MRTGSYLSQGGPGSGKTTISILKAAQIAEGRLRPGQKVLFLSFARATVSRVVEAIEYEQKMPPEQKRLIDVETYHAFFWRILKAHGYLIGLPRRLIILTPPGEAIALSEVRSGFPARNLTDEQKAGRKAAEKAERIRLATAEGRVCFDLFAPYVGNILHGSERIRRLVAAMYPVIILDEFQDTNAEQWRAVQALGMCCRLIALADPEQRIFDWIGADPARLDHFRETFAPMEVDLSTDNHRSTGTEIAMFGNDLLTGKFRQDAYKGVVFDDFAPFPNPAMTKLVTTTYAARQRLSKQGVNDWSLAILVPTKKMTRFVSDAFRQPPAGMTKVPHSAVIEMEAAILGAEIIAFLMQPAADGRHFAQFIDLMRNYFQGKGGDDPTQGALKEAANIRKAYDKWVACQAAGKAIRKNSILANMLAVYEQTRALTLTGDPDKDWRAMRRILASGACQEIERGRRRGSEHPCSGERDAAPANSVSGLARQWPVPQCPFHHAAGVYAGALFFQRQTRDGRRSDEHAQGKGKAVRRSDHLRGMANQNGRASRPTTPTVLCASIPEIRSMTRRARIFASA